jgi:uncharacterized protein (TIGR03437 family)
VNRVSDPVPLRIEAAAPAIVAAVRTNGAAVLYVTGLGATDPAVREGAAAAAVPLARTLLQPSVRIGGQPAAVFFSGLAPGLVGVYQVNALLPSDAGARLEIVLEAAGRQSNPFALQP